MAVIIIGVAIGVIANSNYQEITTMRDQRNLQLSLNDCKRLFVTGSDRADCFDKSINVFGTEQEKQQWKAGYFDP